MVNLVVRFAKSFKDQLVGLIGKSIPEPIMFYTRFGIHTFGVKFPIDVIILDRNNKAVRIKKSLKQNRIFVWNVKFNKVIELPSGEVDKKSIVIGKMLKLNIVDH